MAEATWWLVSRQCTQVLAARPVVQHPAIARAVSIAVLLN